MTVDPDPEPGAEGDGGIGPLVPAGCIDWTIDFRRFGLGLSPFSARGSRFL